MRLYNRKDLRPSQLQARLRLFYDGKLRTKEKIADDWAFVPLCCKDRRTEAATCAVDDFSCLTALVRFDGKLRRAHRFSLALKPLVHARVTRGTHRQSGVSAWWKIITCFFLVLKKINPMSSQMAFSQYPGSKVNNCRSFHGGWQRGQTKDRKICSPWWKWWSTGENCHSSRLSIPVSFCVGFGSVCSLDVRVVIIFTRSQGRVYNIRWKVLLLLK